MPRKNPSDQDSIAPALKAAIGERLVMLRHRSRKSVAEVAEKAGIARQHLYRLEQGRVPNPGVELLSRLASALGAGVAELLPLEPEAEGVLGQLRIHWRQLDEADRSALRDLAAALASPSEASRQYRIRFRQSFAAESSPAARIPDEVKVIAQFIAQREGRPKSWAAYTREANALRRELRSRMR